ncbi:MAG: DUF3365 domain-containing protein [Nitrospiraceae bacterium]|nr:DUF3365 domain-containing protein [Nitrospiraceae bacterium]
MNRVNVSLYAVALTVLLSRGKTRLLQNALLRSHAWWGQNSPQVSQIDQPSHPPNPGAPRRVLSLARPQRARRRIVLFAYVEPLSDARTKLAVFFSILLISGLWWGPFALSAKERPGSPGIPPEKAAAYIYAVIKADRTLYTTEIVNRLQAKGVTAASEHWEQENALMLPAQFLQHSGKLAAENGSGIRYRLIGLWPIYRRNAPASDLERNALESLRKNPALPVTGIVTSGRQQYFQAIYPDLAVSPACVDCHNGHLLSPKRDFKLNDVMGGIAITIPLE